MIRKSGEPFFPGSAQTGRVPALVSWSSCMLARMVLGMVMAGAIAGPALAGMMSADEARKFVAGKVFAFTCVDGTRGAGRILEDMGAAGSVQFSGSGPIRHVRLPGNTCRSAVGAVRFAQGIAVRALLEPRRARRALVPRIGLGHGLRLLRFPSPGCAADADGSRGGAAALGATTGSTRSADASHTEVSTRVETPAVESSRLEPVKSVEPARTESAPELRRSTD